MREALAPEDRGEAAWRSPVLLVDDLSVLLGLGVGAVAVLDFIHYCRAAVCCSLQVPAGPGPAGVRWSPGLRVRGVSSALAALKSVGLPAGLPSEWKGWRAPPRTGQSRLLPLAPALPRGRCLLGQVTVPLQCLKDQSR